MPNLQFYTLCPVYISCYRDSLFIQFLSGSSTSLSSFLYVLVFLLFFWSSISYENDNKDDDNDEIDDNNNNHDNDDTDKVDGPFVVKDNILLLLLLLGSKYSNFTHSIFHFRNIRVRKQWVRQKRDE